MTRDEILNMEAGREMDALIAEKVMGHKVKRNASLFSRGQVFQGMSEGFAELLHYSKDIAAAWLAVEEICIDAPVGCWTGPVFQLNFEFGEAHAVLENLDSIGAYEESVEAYAETAPLAICRAALLATMDDK